MKAGTLPCLDFPKANTTHTTHGLHPFAAKFPPQLVAWAIERYSQPDQVICDPMAGSGTTLVEACRLGRQSIGFDIDPLACLISRAKSTPLDVEHLTQCNQLITKLITEITTEYSQELISGVLPVGIEPAETLPALPNLNYWFSPQVQVALVLLKRAIVQVTAPVEIKTLWYVIFSSLIVAKHSVANARDIVHSRHHYYVHPQPPDPLGRFCRRLRQVERQMHDFRPTDNMLPLGEAEISCQDSRNIPLEDRSVDLVIMSPPYCNALDYTRAHRMAVAWLSDVLNTPLKEYIMRGRDYIGSERGQHGRETIPTGIQDVDAISNQVTAVDAQRGQLVASYFNDMGSVIGEIGRILRPGGHAVLVICPSNIRRIPIAWHEAFAALAENLAPDRRMCELEVITRIIDDHRRILPYMNAGTQLASRMRTEYVQILRHEG
jgi:DNA modification methylase